MERKIMKIAIANDHAGTEYKKVIKAHLEEAGHTVENFGTDETTSVDYPDYAEKVANAVTNGGYELGILICGTGVGMSIAANKVNGVRASLCGDCFSAEMTRRHNNSNILCLGARVLGIDLALRIVDTYVNTPFDGGRHARRVAKITALEEKN